MKKRTNGKPEMVEPLRRELNIPEGANRSEKLVILEAYATAHPEIPLNFIAKVGGVGQGTLYARIHYGLHGHTQAAKRHELIFDLIKTLHPDKSKPVLMAPLYRRIKSLGYKLSLDTLRKMLKENGYRTFSVNQNA